MLFRSTMQHPGDRVVRDAATLARPRQFSQRGIDSELKELTNTQRDGVTIYAVGNSDRIVTHAIGGLQKNGRVKHLPFLRATRPPEVLQYFPLRRRQDQGLSLRDEWHKPFCHGNVLLDSFQQNDHTAMAIWRLCLPDAVLIPPTSP